MQTELVFKTVERTLPLVDLLLGLGNCRLLKTSETKPTNNLTPARDSIMTPRQRRAAQSDKIGSAIYNQQRKFR